MKKAVIAFGLVTLIVLAACITCAAYDPNWKKSQCDAYSFHGLHERYVYGGDRGWIDNDIWDSSSTEGVDCSDYVPRCLAIPNYVGEHTRSGHPYGTVHLYPGVPNTIRLGGVNDMQQWDFWVWDGHTGLFKQYSGTNIITREARGSAYGVVEMSRSKQSLIDMGTRYYRRANWGAEIVNPPYYFTSNTQGWAALNGVSGILWAGGSWPGCMYFDQTGNDSQVLSPATSFVGASNEYISVRVYPQSGSSPSHDMKLYWKISDEAYFDEAKSSPVVNYTAQNEWATINLDVSNHPKWVGKTITALRLDFDTVNHGTRFIVDHVIRQAVAPTEIIIDNPQGTCSDSWATSTSAADKYGADYRWRSTTAISDPFTWTPNIPTAGNYEVYAWWPAGSNRSPEAPYIITYNGGTANVPVNQQTGGGQWNSLGVYPFAAGTSGNVKLSCWAPSGYVVCADAVKFVKR